MSGDQQLKQFYDAVARYVEDGETLLFGVQKTVSGADGRPIILASGAPRCCMVPLRPNWRSGHLRNPEALYLNTAVFDAEKYSQRESACYDNCNTVAFVMLDDIGTKVPMDRLAVPPTWLLETSPGNFQAGYVINEFIDPRQYAASIAALARSGLSDPGANNAVRWARVPGSINLKPGRDRFAARLVEWRPEVEVSVPELLRAYGISIIAADYNGTASSTSIRLEDDGTDNVLAWLNDQGHVFSDRNAEGWYAVQCPNSDEHSDGNPDGRYHPVSRSYKCFHGHCAHIDSSEFLSWVAEEGGPDERPGVRHDLAANVMRPAIEAIANIRAAAAEEAKDWLFPPGGAGDADAVAATVELRNEIITRNRLSRDELFSRYAYVETGDCYFDLATRQRILRQTFDALYRHLHCRSRHAGPRANGTISPSRWFDEHREDCGGVSVWNVTYAPGHGPVIDMEGVRYGNLWRDTRVTATGGSAKVWLDLLHRLVPNDTDREHLLDMLAFKIQFPKVKINHQLYWGSAPGCGKDTAIEPFLYAMSGSCDVTGRENVSVVDLETMVSSFGSHLMAEVIVVNEVQESSKVEKRSTENKLKPYCAAPPYTLSVNLKHQHPFEIVNVVSMIFFSNYRNGLTLPHDDRRIFVLWSECEKMPEDMADEIWNWYDNGGRDAVAAFLRGRDVSKFNPKAAAPMTDAKRILCDESLTDAESFMMSAIGNLRAPFDKELLVFPFAAQIDYLVSIMPSTMVRGLTVKAIQHALEHCGWIDVGRVRTHGKQYVRVICRRHIIEKYTKSQIAEMAYETVEPASAHAPLQVVK